MTPYPLSMPARWMTTSLPDIPCASTLGALRRGVCDHSTGTCKCQGGFEGNACQRMSCPSSCSGNGRCMTMKVIAPHATDPYGSLGGYTYGENPSAAQTWDADSSQVCLCDSFGYEGDLRYKLPSYFSPDCSYRMCPVGDNPAIWGTGNDSAAFEVQQLKCYATQGYFTLTFRDKTTVALHFNATLATVRAALEKISTIGRVHVGAYHPYLP